MEIKIALAGNPNCGKTTLFNALTGSNQYVGNWPGVTVEKKEGKLKGNKDVVIQDLPGIYSLSPYTLEEVVARSYLVNERPDAILNIVDGTNIERNLYLTTQLIELGIPVVVAVNMIDLVRKNGDEIDLDKLGRELGCEVVEMSALKGEGGMEAAQKAVAIAQTKRAVELPHVFTGSVEHAIAHIEESVADKVEAHLLRWYAIKIFERDEKVLAELNLSEDLAAHLEEHIADCEKEADDDAESIITNQRYAYISSVVGKAVRKKAPKHSLSISDKIDRVVTNRILALPIFVAIMFSIYAIAMGPWTVSIGTRGTDWANDGLFGDGYHLVGIGDSEYEEAAEEYSRNVSMVEVFAEAAEKAGLAPAEATDVTANLEIVNDEGEVEEVIPVDYDAYLAATEAAEAEEPDPADYGVWVPGVPALIEKGLDALGVDGWVHGLIMDGIVAGVGAVLGFVPQMLVLFLLLSILEDVGYMARVAFIMDRLFRRFGLSGKSFIPMLVATGCGVPGIMASRTIEQDRDRKMTIMTTGFIPCGAKMPIIGLFAGAIFGNSAWVATSAFFIGIAAVVITGIMLKKFKAFAGEPAPFVMELPSYHAPSAGNVVRATWERGWSFIKRAGTVILLSSIILWFLMSYGFGEAGFGPVEDINTSLLAAIGSAIAWIFAPLGWVGDMAWRAAVATITGLIAKEEVVMTLAQTYNFMDEVSEAGNEIWPLVAQDFGAITAYSFMIFQLLCAPCFAAMGAIKREMNNAKWTLAAIGYMTGFAYVASLIVYQLGGLITGEAVFGMGTVVAVALLAGIFFLLFRKGYQGDTSTHNLTSVAAKEAAGK